MMRRLHPARLGGHWLRHRHTVGALHADLRGRGAQHAATVDLNLARLAVARHRHIQMRGVLQHIIAAPDLDGGAVLREDHQVAPLQLAEILRRGVMIGPHRVRRDRQRHRLAIRALQRDGAG
jgi:hypothetical protein